ncbi:MAG: hypothetical protein JWN14_1911, partial [Chthonomonadales bacterium]|nr:hypothetical protein [Chthonomonadales bacterium]
HLVMMPWENWISPRMIVCDLNEPIKTRKYQTPAQTMPVLKAYSIQHPTYVTISEKQLSGVDGNIEIDTYQTQDRLELASDSKPKPHSVCKLKLPEGMIYIKGFVSPQMQSVSYRVQSPQTSPIRVWLHRIIPIFDVKPALIEALWVSGADGKGLREIGHIPLKTEDDGIDNIQWLPDGKQIGFVYRSTLYVVSAKPGK